MSENPQFHAEPEPKSRFTLPSAYTILFALIVLVGDRDVGHSRPARTT